MEFVNTFRFTKEDVLNLCSLLRFPDRVDVGFRYKVSGQGVTLGALGEVGISWTAFMLTRYFGRSRPAISAIFEACCVARAT